MRLVFLLLFFLVSQKVLAKTVHSPPRVVNTVSVTAAEDD